MLRLNIVDAYLVKNSLLLLADSKRLIQNQM